MRGEIPPVVDIARIPETDLLGRGLAGELAAITQLVEDHLHPVWRIAVVAAPDLASARAAAAVGFADGLQAAGRSRDATVSLRTRLVAAVRRVAAASIHSGGPTLSTGATGAVLAAFAVLPEQSRTALWLTEVEGGTVEQVAPVLGIPRREAAAVVERAVRRFRELLAADAAAGAAVEGDEESSGCELVRRALPDHAAGRLDADAKAELRSHLAGCGSCAAWLAMVVAPRTELRRAVPVLPPDLAMLVVEECQSRLRPAAVAGFGAGVEKALGAAAAAVIAFGLGGVALLSGAKAPKVAVAFADAQGEEPLEPDGLPTGESAAGDVLLPPPGTSGPLSGSGSISSSSSDADGSSPNRSSAPAAVPPPVAVTPPVAVVPGPTTPPPTTPPPSGPPAPPATDPGTQVEVALGGSGGVELGVGDCTGMSIGDLTVGCDTEPSASGPIGVDVELPIPGLPTISIG